MTDAASRGAEAAGSEVDWEQLRSEARQAAGRAYAPYSQVRVGAAALVDDGRVVTGANVENASYGLSLCAECGVASALVGSGGGRLVALSVVAGDGAYLAPCGRCRQILFEHGGPGLLIDTGDAVSTLADLLPGAFGPADLSTRADGSPATGPAETSPGTGDPAPPTSGTEMSS